MNLGQWPGQWAGQWFGATAADPNAMSGSGSITLTGTGTLKGIASLAGTASISVGGTGTLTGTAGLDGTGSITVSGTGTLTDTGGTLPDPRLDSILALLTGKKVYDPATKLWRVYDAGGAELADPGGVLLRGLHGWLLQANVQQAANGDWLIRARRRGRR